MSKRNETRYNEAQDAMRDGADDEEIRRTYGFAPGVIKACVPVSRIGGRNGN